jgi:hypothetical protein
MLAHLLCQGVIFFVSVWISTQSISPLLFVATRVSFSQVDLGVLRGRGISSLGPDVHIDRLLPEIVYTHGTSVSQGVSVLLIRLLLSDNPTVLMFTNARFFTYSGSLEFSSPTARDLVRFRSALVFLLSTLQSFFLSVFFGYLGTFPLSIAYCQRSSTPTAHRCRREFRCFSFGFYSATTQQF